MKSQKSRDSAIGIRRARLFIQRDLSWMAGFPAAPGEWLSLSLGRPASRQRLDRELLHRSSRAVHTLVRRFPQALPQLVGDTQSWQRRRQALLETLKPVVHLDSPLPRDPLAHHPEAGESLLRLARRSRRDAPRLERLQTALTWLCWTELDSLRPALLWLLAHRPALQALDAVPGGQLPLAVRLWQLRRSHGERWLAPCLEWLSRPGLFAHPTDAAAEFGHQAARYLEGARKRLPETPKPRLGADLILWIEELAQQDDATRRRALELFSLLLPAERQAEWQRWWQRAESTLASARAIRQRPGHHPSPARRQKRLRGKLRKLDSKRPPSLPAGQVLSVLRELPSAEYLDFYRAIVPSLRRWPEVRGNVPVRLVFARYWLRLAGRCDPPERAALLRLIRALCGYWRTRGFRLEALEPWAQVWRDQRKFYPLDWRLLRDFRERARLRAFFAFLAGAPGPVSVAEADLLAGLVEKLPAERVEAAFAQVRDSPLADDGVSDRLLALAGRLTAGDESRFLAVLNALHSYQYRRSLTLQDFERTVAALEELGRPQAVSRCIEAGHLGLLVEVSRKLRVVSDLGNVAPGPELRPPAGLSWTQRYPATLRPALRELASCDGHAARTAARLLRKEFPEPAALRREIAALRRDPCPEASKAARLRNLEARLGVEPRVSPQRQANLEEKILRSAARHLVERWSRASSRAEDRALCRYLGVAELPEWCGRDDVREALLAVPALEPAFRQLARRLFRRRGQPPPWDLREDPVNAAFLERMGDLGIDVAPWIDAGPVLKAEGEGGTKVELALEHDPLEVLQMGGYFRTCLAPGAFNFFSAVANACDVNKQVLYGRDARGVVVARALLALTAEGGLLCFHPYCRASGLDFARLSQEYARRLAEAMGTLVVAAGEVPRLITADWWDDGPTSPTEQHPALAKGSPFRRSLAELPPERLATAIREAFAPLDCNELTLPLVLHLPELDERPELALGVIPVAEQLELPTDALLRLGRLALESGGAGQGRPLAPRLMSRALRSFRESAYEQLDVVELLADLDPSRTLRLLRLTRHRSVRRWDQEEDLHRLFLGARASRNLGRRKQAGELLELARRIAPNKAARAECDRLLAELD